MSEEDVGLPDRLPKEPLAAAVARGLREAIIKGEIPPDSRIKQADVAKRFGVSRSPVREAFLDLAADGFVELERDVGARVTPFDDRELVEVYLAREALEPIIIEATCEMITDEEFAAIRQMNDRSEEYAAVGDITGYLRIDAEMHAALLEASGMKVLSGIAAGLWRRTHRYRFAYTSIDRIETSVLEHRLLLDTIEQGDAVDAADIYRIHTRRTRVTLLEGGFPRKGKGLLGRGHDGLADGELNER